MVYCIRKKISLGFGYVTIAEPTEIGKTLLRPHALKTSLLGWLMKQFLSFYVSLECKRTRIKARKHSLPADILTDKKNTHTHIHRLV